MESWAKLTVPRLSEPRRGKIERGYVVLLVILLSQSHGRLATNTPLRRMELTIRSQMKTSMPCFSTGDATATTALQLPNVLFKAGLGQKIVDEYALNSAVAERTVDNIYKAIENVLKSRVYRR